MSSTSSRHGAEAFESPASSTTAPPKRVRKSRKRSDDDTAQRERKRAMDRKAQRQSREKTKSHIAHLEKLVEMLYEKNDSAANIELVEEVGRLNAEIERLRKIIWNIRNLVGSDVLGLNLDVAKSPQFLNDNEDEKPPDEDIRCNSIISHEAIDLSNATQMDDILDTSHLDESPESSNCFSMSTINRDRVIHDDKLNCMTFDNYEELHLPNPSWDNKNDNNNNHDDSNNNKLSSSIRHSENRSNTPPTAFQLWTFLNHPPVPPHLDPKSHPISTTPCQIWKFANKIYGNIFAIPPSEATSAARFDSGLLFQVIRDGWDTLNLEQKANPVLRILRDVDQQLFMHLDPTSRLAIVYKSQALVKVSHPSTLIRLHYHVTNLNLRTVETKY